jgi:2'-5' RNA ligase
MDFFIGIVPPEEYKEKLQRIKKAGHSEPHITVKAQSGLTDDLGWLEAVREVCRGFPAFKMQLEEPKYFGEQVLYLSVDSAEVFQLHRKLVEAVGVTPELGQRFYELDFYTPHLTLGQRSYGYTLKELQEIESTANDFLQPFPAFEVTYVRIYRKEHRGGHYEKFIDLTLEG